MKNVIIIPARMASTRLPGKPLLDVVGKSLLRRTYEQAKKTKADEVWVATSDELIAVHCATHSIPVIKSQEDFPTGTHRVADATWRIKDVGLLDNVINWQCDEPSVKPESVNKLVDCLESGQYELATLVTRNRNDYSNEVRAAVSFGLCHWFSHLALPPYMRHIGIYGFSYPRLINSMRNMECTEISKAESLEQLAWIENGWKIGAVEVDDPAISVNWQFHLDDLIESCKADEVS